MHMMRSVGVVTFLLKNDQDNLRSCSSKQNENDISMLNSIIIEITPNIGSCNHSSKCSHNRNVGKYG